MSEYDLESLRGLEKRLAEASGWDREIEALLWAELDGRDVRYDCGKVLAKSRKPPHNECLLGFIDPGKVSRNFSAAGGHRLAIDTVTASLDAAVSLVERVLPGWFWRVGHSTLYAGWAHLNRVHPDHCNPEDVSSADAAAPALALCLAIVRALIAEQSK